MRLACTLFTLIAVGVYAPGGLQAAPPARVSFQRDVAPILRTMCISCHNGAEAKGGFDLTSAKTAFARGEDGARAGVGGAHPGCLRHDRG